MEFFVKIIAFMKIWESSFQNDEPIGAEILNDYVEDFYNSMPEGMDYLTESVIISMMEISHERMGAVLRCVYSMKYREKKDLL